MVGHRGKCFQASRYPQPHRKPRDPIGTKPDKCQAREDGFEEFEQLQREAVMIDDCFSLGESKSIEWECLVGFRSFVGPHVCFPHTIHPICALPIDVVLLHYNYRFLTICLILSNVEP